MSKFAYVPYIYDGTKSIDLIGSDKCKCKKDKKDSCRCVKPCKCIKCIKCIKPCKSKSEHSSCTKKDKKDKREPPIVINVNVEIINKDY